MKKGSGISPRKVRREAAVVQLHSVVRAAPQANQPTNRYASQQKVFLLLSGVQVPNIAPVGIRETKFVSV